MFTSLVETFFTFGSILLFIVTLVFLIAQLKRDNSIMDIAYGLIFLLTSLGTLLVLNSVGQTALLIILGIALWSIRLSLRIYRKNQGKPEDQRYAAWRSKWEQRGHWYFLLRSYLQINILQGLIIFIVSLPFIISAANLSLNPAGEISWFAIVGSLVFLFGLTFESVSDHQLDRFIAQKKAGTATANIMQTGLFRYSRRPNYFGETLIWWGLAIIVLPLPFGLLALLSPLTITYIVTKVTGPMLEKIFLANNHDEYSAYMAKTSYFFPLPPRK